MKMWYSVKVAGLRPNSAKVYRDIINAHLAPFFKSGLLSDVKPMHIKRLMADKSNLSHSRQAKILSTVSQVMESAVADGLVIKNPCAGIVASGDRPKEKTPLTRQQQTEIVSAVKETRAELFVLLCLYAGLRREEALGLMWSSVNVDCDTPYIEIKHTVSLGQSGLEHTEKLKSKAARRTIPVPAVLAEALKRGRKNASSVFVVPAAHGGTLTESGVRRLWWIVQKNIGFYAHPHLLRHTYITELCASGMDIKKIQYLAGHEDVTMTLRVYAHVRGNTPQELSGDISRIFSGSK